MKLAHLGTAMLTVSTCLLLMSCKQKTGLEQLTAKYESLKGFRSTYVVQEPGKPDLEVKAYGSAPGRVRVEGKGFEIVCNEENGYYESVADRKLYDWQPNYGGSAVGTGAL
ncbi:MAG TPA: hypothetical protein VK171_06865, partial [Fimbriimonas sp.]|nr:hypothetical protein [Fimbriimonas sp.]